MFSPGLVRFNEHGGIVPLHALRKEEAMMKSFVTVLFILLGVAAGYLVKDCTGNDDLATLAAIGVAVGLILMGHVGVQLNLPKHG